MAKIVELPRLSDTMEEGVIAKWHIKEGDKVKRGQLIADIETDKATMEFESFDAGTVLRLVAAEGDALAIGKPIAVLGKEGEDADAALSAHGGAPPAAAPSAAVSPASAAPAPALAPAPTPAPTPDPTPDPTHESAAPAGRANERIAASPLARRLARELGVDLAQLSGSGPHGRIIKTDVEGAAAGHPGATAGAGATITEGARAFVTRPDTPQKLSQMRKAIAKRMGQANAEIPHFYLTSKIEMDRAVAARKEINEAFPDAKVSFNDFVILAAAAALRQHPEINAYWDGSTIVWRGDIHVGMAVAVEEGLLVPPIRFTDQKTLREIGREAKDLGARARDKKLSPSEMTGSTFTVSNLGMFGIEEFSAVVNPGEGAILAVGAIVDEVVADGTGFRVAKRMKVTLACDHRVMDGAVGAKFLVTFRGLLERPLAMMA
jgi:pyruvate dehydrogenase E2 component (dihydrolipoamide acetyltransferase)